MAKTIKPGSRESRAFQFDRAQVDEEQRTVTLAFASEFPVDRYWGREILDMQESSIRLGRLRGGAPLLMDHDATDQVGVIESVDIGLDRVGRALVRFGKSARAEEVFRDVLDGIRRNVSFGYTIHEATLQEMRDDGDVYRVTDWEPYEITICSVPADPTVGIGRSADKQNSRVEIIDDQESKMTIPVEAVNEKEVLARGTQEGVQSERKRVSDIAAMGEQFRALGGDKLAGEAIQSGKGVEEFRAQLLQHVASQPKPTADIGLTDKEAGEFRFLRLMNALSNPNDRKAQEAAAFEMECSRAVADALGRAPQGFFVPNDVMRRQSRAMNVGTAAQGGNLVATDLLSQDFIEMLRNAMVLSGLGVRTLSGLVGNIAIPRQTGGGTAYWVAEGNAPTTSNQAIDQVTMSPKTVGAFTDVARKLLLQSSIDVEMMVRQDLATTLALELERAAVNGSGASNEPKGILQTSGIGAVIGGTDGAAMNWGHVVDLETSVQVANAAVGSLGYLVNSKVRGKLKKTEKATNTAQFIWEKGSEPLNGYQAAVTNMVPSNLTKGTANGICSAAIFGNFADLVIGLWGALDITVDPYSNSTSGTVRIVTLQDVDVAIRHAASFAAMKDILTA